MPAAKKYKLFALQDQSDAKPLCAFFSSPGGCRNGDNCKFMHGSDGAETGPTKENNAVKEVSDSTSVVSSESEGEIRMEFKGEDEDDSQSEGEIPSPPSPPETPKNEIKQTIKTKGQKRKRTDDSEARRDVGLFAMPKKTSGPLPGSVAPMKTNSKQKQAKKQQPAARQSMKKEAAKAPAPPKVRTPSPGVPDFRKLMESLPVATFSLPLNDDGTRNPESMQAEKSSNPSTAQAARSKPKENGLPLPKSTEVGRKWLKLVKKSQEHDGYAPVFDFSKYKEMDNEAGIRSEWIKAKPFGSWCENNPQAIAIDCEMCETKDPLTGNKNHKALCRISIINAEKPEEVLLDTLVKPEWPVSDHRTQINGIAKENLENVEFTLRHAQAFMMALCSEETVIVGHAVHNDLVSLNFEHYCVADSTFLFKAKDSPTATVSLKDLVQSVFQKPMPEVHDSVNDARKSLECILYYMEKDGHVDPVERTPRNNGHQLFVHRIPKQCTPKHLINMFLAHTCVQPKDVDDIEFGADKGKTHVSFRSSRHASLAFDTLDSTAEEDKSGRLQKKVYLRNGDYVRIRKMTYRPQGSTPSKSGTTRSRSSTPRRNQA